MVPLRELPQNTLAAWNIREYRLKTDGQLIGENDVTVALRKPHARESPPNCPSSTSSYTLEQDKLMDREKAIDRIKWNYIDELNTFITSPWIRTGLFDQMAHPPLMDPNGCRKKWQVILLWSEPWKIVLSFQNVCP